MDSPQFTAAPPGVGIDATLTRCDDRRWQAAVDRREVGRGEARPRSDGRLFLSIDTWHGTVFDRLANAMVADLAGPLHTMVDEADHDLIARWERAGLAVRRREQEFLLATDPSGTGLDLAAVPPGVSILDVGAARQPVLCEAYDVIRAEVDDTVGWAVMPVEVPPRPAGDPLDPSRYAVAVEGDRYVGLLRVVARRRHARIGLVAVREDRQRRGIARALLGAVLGTLHHGGVDTVTVEVDERLTAATALFTGIGARRVGGAVELVRAR